jgi:hypothetical protein
MPGSTTRQRLLLLPLLLLPLLLSGQEQDLALSASAHPAALPAAGDRGGGDSSSSQEVALCAPLTTMLRLSNPLHGEHLVISARIVVPADAPADLGVAAFVTDQHGHWFQSGHGIHLQPGLQIIRLPVGSGDGLISEPAHSSWGQAEAALANLGGVYFWSASASRSVLRIYDLQVHPGVLGEDAAEEPRLQALWVQGVSASAHGSTAHGRTGERWSASLQPQPFPRNPCDPSEFALDCEITAPDGSRQTVAGFYDQEMRSQDRGDREQLQAVGSGHFTVRYRPRQSGCYHLALVARWGDGRSVHSELPDLVVEGARWDGYARVDAQDHRFFAIDGAFYWPLGPNLRSVYDTRGKEHLNTIQTPDRGTLAYADYLTRLAAHGVSCVEIWMSSWNLALEWRADWPGFYGQGRYNIENAWRLDQILDLAYQRGIRINLVINNHGQASADSDREWDSNPYNRQRGGELDDPAQMFTSAYALTGEEHLRRYLVARYADHPAVLGWKLWSEVNLTAGPADVLRRWHANAEARWHALDIYGHGVTSHWCGDYHAPDRVIVAQPGLDYVCIDAYHGPEQMIADLLYSSTMDPVPGRGLAQFVKPVLTTEYGCNWDAGPEQQMLAEHASGPWAALVSGHAGAPMLWWVEWLDQHSLFSVYSAVSRFLEHEDLRGAAARSIVLGATAGETALWSRAWSRPGRMLGYVLDPAWGSGTSAATPMAHVQIRIGSSIGAGSMTVEWWDADAGASHATQIIDHPGGALVLQAPLFERHIAFKLYRTAAHAP